MWPQTYTPLAGSLGWSALAAALPLLILLYLLGVKRKAAWLAGASGLAAAVLVALVCYRMPLLPLLSAALYGAAFGIFPIGWILFSAILLYRLTVVTGKFEILKQSVSALTPDRRLQALLIAFAFGAFLEGAAGFGAPVAVSAAMLTGLGFSPFYAAGICLLANTAPVAFGSIGIPIVTLNAVTGLPLDRLSAGVGRLCAPVSLIVPAYLIGVMGGRKALKAVFPGVAVCGITFAGVQFLVSNFLGPQLTDILSSLAAIAALLVLFALWRPKDTEESGPRAKVAYSARQILGAWLPYLLLVICVLMWGFGPLRDRLHSFTLVLPWPGLHNQVLKLPPVAATPSPYAAVYSFNWLSAAGTACLLSVLLTAAIFRVRPKQLARVAGETVRQLWLPQLTIAAVLASAFVMNYSGTTATLGLAMAHTGALFPFFSALLGWLGVFLTGSDTSANALFGNLQVVTANSLHMNPLLMAAANSSGGVMGKMISLQSIAVAAAATGMAASEESRLFRFTLRHSVLLACLLGTITVAYAYLFPQLAP